VPGGAVCGAMMDPVENGPTPQDLWRVREGQGSGAGHALASAMGHRSGLGGEEGSRPREHSRSVPKAKKVSKKRGNVAKSWFTSVQRKMRVGIGGNDASRRRGERGHRPAAKEA
jgi:hypothetical protein